MVISRAVPGSVMAAVQHYGSPKSISSAEAGGGSAPKTSSKSMAGLKLESQAPPSSLGNLNCNFHDFITQLIYERCLEGAGGLTEGQKEQLQFSSVLFQRKAVIPEAPTLPYKGSSPFPSSDPGQHVLTPAGFKTPVL